MPVIERDTLRAAVSHALANTADVPQPAVERLRTWVTETKTVGDNFNCGCPLSGSGLYDILNDARRLFDPSIRMPEWMYTFYDEFDEYMLTKVMDEWGCAAENVILTVVDA